MFVAARLPGETVRAVVTCETAHFLRADAVEVLDASPDRVEPPCPYARPGRCGGCDFQHVALPRQRQLKADLVREQLRRLAGVELDVVVSRVPGDVDGLGWRTRVSFGVDGSGRAGLHRHRSSDLELVDRCLIASPAVEAVGAERLPWPGATSVEVAAAGDQRVVAVAGRRAQLPDVDAGVLVEGRAGAGAARAAARGARPLLRGRRRRLLAGAPGRPPRRWRGRCSTGWTRSRGRARSTCTPGSGCSRRCWGSGGCSVLAVESDPRACADAARNTADLPQVKVRTAAVDAAGVRRLGAPDLVVLDPPRAGAGVETTRALAALRPRALAYVACDPASFARDLRVLLDAGWSLERLRGFDLFPMTEHVELVALLTPPA